MSETGTSFKKITSIQGKKKPMAGRPWVYRIIRLLTGVSLTQRRSLACFPTLDNLSGSWVYRKHGNRVMGTADNLAKVTTFATMLNNNSLGGGLIQHDGVCFRAIHDAQSATFLGNTFIVIYISYVIHSKILLS